MWWHCFLSVADSLTKHNRRHESGSSGTDMNHRASGKIQSAHLAHPTLYAPYPMSERIIDESCPKNYKKQKRAELYAFCKRARNQCRRNDRKHHLVDHKGSMRNGGRIIGVGFRADSVQPKPIQASDQSANVWSESKGI